ncbi:MAG: isoprenylcysteine carboxylmethyltransferase family protein [Deltaproteobacteria bacterium]|nr:isoprenylcysteine carboxylmethyltransferase family protein [Deltaproteobacteria bacterium]
MSDENKQPPGSPEPTDSALAVAGGPTFGRATTETEAGSGSTRPAWSEWSAEDIGERLFEWRDYTPIPLIALVLFACEPSVKSAVLGTLIVVLGELVRIYSVAFIGSVSRTRNVETAGSALITSGPFSYVRNPLYVGNFLITVGLAVFSGVGWIVFVAAALFGFQYYCIVKHEERLLVGRFGTAYEEYMTQVPPWVPTKWPTLENLEWPTTFSPALKSERRTLLAIAFMLISLSLLSGSGRPPV